MIATAFLTRPQTKNVSARSLVQDSGAPAWLRATARDYRRSQPLAYDESMAKPDGKKRVRWSLWLGAGVLFGLALGFAFGLARPRVRN